MKPCPLYVPVKGARRTNCGTCRHWDWDPDLQKCREEEKLIGGENVEIEILKSDGFEWYKDCIGKRFIVQSESRKGAVVESFRQKAL